ncbi:MAG: hypothetical protein HY427_00470 [Candidatus Levybacteria bacterium]|nr:hypothetical protein [Candidatus Levybacteria bacterium]
MISIRKLIWDVWNIQHIARHHIVPDEVEEVCHREPLVLRGQQKGRLVLMGPTEAKRMLSVILEAKGQGKYYPITAYETDQSDIALYSRLQGGGKDDKNEENK